MWQYRRGIPLQQREDDVIEERLISVYINGTLAAQLVSSGGFVAEAAVGYVVSEGWARPDQILSERTEGQSAFLMLSGEVSHQQLPAFEDIGCLSSAPLNEAVPLDHAFAVPAAYLLQLQGELQRASHEWQTTGGVHAALLACGPHIFCCEDISRHTALDKVIGHGITASWDLAECVLMGTGRVPAHAVMQAVHARVPVIVSRSATTFQAILLAERLNITLIAFSRAGRLNIYTHPERVVLS